MVHLPPWRPCGILFNYIFADRIGANHGDIADSSETKIFTGFLNILQRILQELAEYGGMGLSYKCFLGFMSVTVLKYYKEKCICYW